MRQHRELFEKVRKYTGMWLDEETYGSATAFVSGYDAACEGGLLAGFKEWLVVRVGSGTNLAWSALVLHAAFPDHSSPQEALDPDPRVHRQAIETLFRLLAEFEDARAGSDGLRRIYSAFEQWVHDHEAR